MPQLKSPRSLYNISLSKTRAWLAELAGAIVASDGNYEREECRIRLAMVNRFVGRTVPLDIIEELYNSPEVLLVRRGNGPALFEDQAAVDPRVLLSVYIRWNMRTLTAHRFIDDGFWKSWLPSLRNLVRLDLNKVCTDEILAEVGRNCAQLEFANIMSKSCHARTRGRHNALRLQLCVSDTGLDSLASCKRLREIQMTCVIRKGCGGRQVTEEGIRRLLLALPQLARINYTDTGALTDAMPAGTKLALVSVTDYHPRATRVFSLPSLCPHLSELNLTYAFSSDDRRSEVIAALASSDLRLSALSLTNFPLDEHLERYLQKKGRFLQKISFVSNSVRSVDGFFAFLGLACPNLEQLHAQFHLFESGVVRCTCDPCDAIFSRLRSLMVKGVLWDSHRVLPLLLKNAGCIEKVVLNNLTYSGCLDETMELLQKTNRFLHLETIDFLRGIKVSFQFLRKFLLACPVLKHVTVESDSQAFFDLVVQLRDELRTKNMDIYIEVYNGV